MRVSVLRYAVDHLLGGEGLVLPVPPRHCLDLIGDVAHQQFPVHRVFEHHQNVVWATALRCTWLLMVRRAWSLGMSAARSAESPPDTRDPVER
ncbi:hypothetical protein ACFXHA_17025 [Nocardia sp. NPDC059240]|uniref:hypothetical protein n=1 Tax=Nocardia sp. NPDC059240 TaxID=3346786 RepID=UPI003699D10A